MRACAERLLAQDVEKFPSVEVEKRTLRLRGHVGLIVREIEPAALALPEDSVPRICALSCVGDARVRWGAEPGRGLRIWRASGTRPVITSDSKTAQVSDLGLHRGAGDENRTRALSLGS
ncbi:DUF6415 family natural product biosynthesis protein [Streptomyces iakyrus]